MIQYVCDRCGKTIDDETSKKNYATYQIKKRHKNFGLEPPLDLCPDCYKSFDKWLKEVKDKNDQRRGDKDAKRK